MLHSAEGGWVLDCGADPDPAREADHTGAGYAAVTGTAGQSGIRDLLDPGRDGEAVWMTPNSNLLHPRTALPTLRGAHPPGRHWLACAVLGAGAGPRAPGGASPHAGVGAGRLPGVAGEAT